MGLAATSSSIGLVAIAAATLSVAGPATAQVLEIKADGAVTRYAGPAIYTDSGARALVPEAAPLASVPVAPAEVAAAITESAQRHAVSAPLAQAVAWQESRFH